MKMEKMVLYTQRVEIAAGYQERRDCADQRIAAFLRACGLVPVPVNNLPEYAEEMAASLRPAGIVFTGGGDLAKYGGNTPERDRTERILLEYALREGIPLLGFCRGMQFIADQFGSGLAPVKNHVACRHAVAGELPHQQVNSFHNWGVTAVPEEFCPLLRSEDGGIEAMRHRRRGVMGIMWHPERETPFAQEDVRLFSDFFGESDCLNGSN